MKMIELLNRIADGEEITKFKYDGLIIERQDSGSYKDNEGDFFIDSICRDLSNLNEEVEILKGSNKIEKIDMFDFFTGYDFGGTDKDLLKHLEHNFEEINRKINQIIDHINKEEK